MCGVSPATATLHLCWAAMSRLCCSVSDPSWDTLSTGTGLRPFLQLCNGINVVPAREKQQKSRLPSLLQRCCPRPQLQSKSPLGCSAHMTENGILHQLLSPAVSAGSAGTDACQGGDGQTGEMPQPLSTSRAAAPAPNWCHPHRNLPYLWSQALFCSTEAQVSIVELPPRAVQPLPATFWSVHLTPCCC